MNTRIFILSLAMMAMSSLQSQAQGIIVYEHNGTQTNIPAAEFDCIVPDASAGNRGVVVKRLDGSSFSVSAAQLDSIITYPQAWDERLTYAIPADLAEKMSRHMPIYNGNTPPTINGVFEFAPNEAVFFEDNPSETGKQYAKIVMKFGNQDMQKNTLDFGYYSSSSQTSASNAAIIGEGDNFTTFFVAEGTSAGIYIKQATIISGTMTPNGIKNAYFGIVMTDKGPDPDNKLMNKGVYRVFRDKDSLSKPTTWNPPSSAAPAHAAKVPDGAVEP
jgi:hypothetical protein